MLPLERSERVELLINGVMWLMYRDINDHSWSNYVYNVHFINAVIKCMYMHEHLM